ITVVEVCKCKEKENSDDLAQLRDESESDSSSGSEVHYNIETSDESLVVTTQAKPKAKENVETIASPPQSKEGGEEADSDGENRPADNAEGGNIMLKSQRMMIVRQRISVTRRVLLKILARLNLNKNENPGYSIQEEPKIQIIALNKVPELKRLFMGYNMYWMAKTLSKYIMEMVPKFYANYYCTMEKKVTSKISIKRSPFLTLSDYSHRDSGANAKRTHYTSVPEPGLSVMPGVWSVCLPRY
ncbi:hypothetical protein HAX54_012157, partial [Datura stramonium]|nr:hypothetical protein [Datura stramonium]